MRDVTISELEQLHPDVCQADDALQMDQDSFRSLYERTARPLWVYLCRKTGDTQLADDLLQESYYRFLRTRTVFENDSHRKNYLFRIATNLANDTYRRVKDEQIPEEFEPAAEHRNRPEHADVARAMDK